jgi:hypothetical protein
MSLLRSRNNTGAAVCTFIGRYLTRWSCHARHGHGTGKARTWRGTERKTKKKSKRKSRRWSQRVTKESDALTLDKGVFKKGSPRAIAKSLKRSAERSHRRKSSPYRSAMSMLTFYINRGGKGLSKTRKNKLEKAKDELRDLYNKD